jgi:hypothetical protein
MIYRHAGLHKVVLHLQNKLSTMLLQLNNAITALLTACSEGVACNLVQACRYQLGTGCWFLRVYKKNIIHKMI